MLDQQAHPSEDIRPAEEPDDFAVIVPVYMGRAFLTELCERLVRTLRTMSDDFSIILVDDRSPDNAWPLICELARSEKRIKGIRLSRNFGQHHAITAGIDYARARWYVVMDCDLQDAPEDIPRLIEKAREGFDVVVGIRKKEGHGFAKRHASRLFYGLFNLLSGVDLNWGSGNFRVFSAPVADGFRRMREQMRFLPASLSLMGFESSGVEVQHYPRRDGKSSYTVRKLIALAGRTILAHSQMPLKLAALLGLLLATGSIFAGLFIAIRVWVWGSPVTGWASLIVAVFVVGGVQIFITGMVGVYIGKIFEEAKRRPLYFVQSTANLEPSPASNPEH